MFPEAGESYNTYGFHSPTPELSSVSSVARFYFYLIGSEYTPGGAVDDDRLSVEPVGDGHNEPGVRHGLLDHGLCWP